MAKKLIPVATVMLWAALSVAQSISTVTLPRAIPSTGYSFTLTATSSCTWSATGLPSGFSLNATTGVLSGSSATPFASVPVNVACGSGNKTFYFSNAVNRSVQWPNTVKLSGFPYINPGSDQFANEWMRLHFDVTVQGTPDLSSLTDFYPSNVRYVDGAGIYPPAINPYIVDTSISRSWLNYENVFVHSDFDYYTGPGGGGTTYWLYMDEFDIFDEPVDFSGSVQNVNPNAARNGLLLFHSSAYTDVSVALYQQSSTYTMANSDYLYVGYSEPFDLVNLAMTTPQTGGTATYQFWNGSTWATLTLTSDGTSGLTTNGTIKFSPPANWAKTSVNSSRSKWWVRIGLSGATILPRLSHIWGDNWLSSSVSCTPACNMRGWSATDSHRVNIGLGPLEYNPTPPANQTARFRYQGRASGYWEWDYNFFNPNATDTGTGDIMESKVQLAQTQSYVTTPATLGSITTGVFYDNIGDWAQWTPSNSDLVAGTTIPGGYGGMFAALTPSLHSALGAGFLVGANLGCAEPCFSAVKAQTQISLNELAAASTTLGYYYYATYQMDPFAAGTHKRIVNFWDNYMAQAPYDPCGYDGLGTCPTYHLWPHNDRSPMQALAGYLIGYNSNTIFEYDITGWSYFYVDEYYVPGATSTTLAVASAMDVTNTPQTLTLVNGSAFTPTDYLGYYLKIGNDFVVCNKIDNTHFSLNTAYGLNYLTRAYPIGTTVQFAVVKHLSTDGVPAYGNIWSWTDYFPAIAGNFGTPDAAGFNGGVRGLWLTGASIGGSADCATTGKCPPVERRDFTNALVLQRAMADYEPSEWDIPSKVIALPTCPACQWQRLHSDGTLDAPSNTVQLLGNESAIYLKGGGSLSAPRLKVLGYAKLQGNVNAH